jgi:hypothetical protein
MLNDEKRAQSVTTDGRPAAPGFENAPAPQPIMPNGQHGAYWVLSQEERAKGFVRPLRRNYRHVGSGGPKHPLRNLTAEEQERYQSCGYVKFEMYPESELPVTGRFWTQEKLDTIGGGCGEVTTMGLVLCETYARDPSYYGSTFCCNCGVHLPVGEFRWTEDGEVVGS